jgi:hypothetical protein
MENHYQLKEKQMNVRDLFIVKAKKVHGDKYVYSKVDYTNNKIRVIITCPKHGDFLQTPNNHLSGKGCRHCGNEQKKLYTSNTEEFIKKSQKIHGNKYDYSEVNYHNCKLPITIFCPNHGPFHQTPNGHLNGSGCPECVRDSQTSNTEEFIQKSVKLHGNKYDYSKVDYQGALNKVTINCLIHGDFDQTPNDHLRGCGCSSCFESKGEKHIATILNSNNIQFIRQKSFDECRGKSNPLRFDFFLPELNVLIEYDGQQHFKPIDYFGGEKSLKKQQHLDTIKNKFASDNNILLIRVPYTLKNEEQIFNYLMDNVLILE